MNVKELVVLTVVAGDVQAEHQYEATHFEAFSGILHIYRGDTAIASYRPDAWHYVFTKENEEAQDGS